MRRHHAADHPNLPRHRRVDEHKTCDLYRKAPGVDLRVDATQRVADQDDGAGDPGLAQDRADLVAHGHGIACALCPGALPVPGTVEGHDVGELGQGLDHGPPRVHVIPQAMDQDDGGRALASPHHLDLAGVPRQ